MNNLDYYINQLSIKEKDSYDQGVYWNENQFQLEYFENSELCCTISYSMLNHIHKTGLNNSIPVNVYRLLVYFFYPMFKKDGSNNE